MSSLKITQAEGQLIAAVSVGGAEALWRMAGRMGPVGDLARMALEKLTEPESDFSPIQAVNVVVRSKD